ncbi:MAG: URC4/urg3 family protein [Rhodospirillales bacterium]|nr:URC4/urg3 family protein [Rhodospirillales bacterium]
MPLDRPEIAGPSARVRALRDPATIRRRSGEIFEAASRGKSTHFTVDISKLDRAAELTVGSIRRDYPSLDIPYHSRWRHFDVGGIDRWKRLVANLPDEKLERVRVAIDLAVTSVLLDAGAGAEWKYRTKDGVFTRSEGLAVASFDMFASGAFSASIDNPYRADAAGLRRFDADRLAKGFKVGESNRLVGLEGRAALMRSLGTAIGKRTDIFGAQARIGNLADLLQGQARAGKLPAARILAVLLDGFADAWPARVVVDGVNVGDVGAHPAAGEGLVPFHKLSQWLTYSLLEPLEWLGLKIVDLDALTGLPEYRNGGLFLDTGTLALRDPSAAGRPHAADSELIVEWRALTVVLLDKVAELVREKLGLAADEFPLAKVLQGGTWTAGRRIAAERRAGGKPPLTVESDGTIF